MTPEEGALFLRALEGSRTASGDRAGKEGAVPRNRRGSGYNDPLDLRYTVDALLEIAGAGSPG